MSAERPQCTATVYVRDTYRYTGRGPGGFEMHYRRKQCSRPATNGQFCWQHDPENKAKLWNRLQQP